MGNTRTQSKYIEDTNMFVLCTRILLIEIESCYVMIDCLKETLVMRTSYSNHALQFKTRRAYSAKSANPQGKGVRRMLMAATCGRPRSIQKMENRKINKIETGKKGKCCRPFAGRLRANFRGKGNACRPPCGPFAGRLRANFWEGKCLQATCGPPCGPFAGQFLEQGKCLQATLRADRGPFAGQFSGQGKCLQAALRADRGQFAGGF
jgi:hypothetical protein